MHVKKMLISKCFVQKNRLSDVTMHDASVYNKDRCSSKYKHPCGVQCRMVAITLLYGVHAVISAVVACKAHYARHILRSAHMA